MVDVVTLLEFTRSQVNSSNVTAILSASSGI
jgi:hypothetical protein